MDASEGSLIKEVKDFQTNTSWIPTTPGKPGVATLPPISKNRQESQPAHGDRSQLRTKQAAWTRASGTTAEAQNAAVDCGSTNSAAVGTKCKVYGDGIKMYNSFSSDDVDMWSNASFRDLLAMAHAGSAVPAAEIAKVEAACSEKNSFKPLISSQRADGFSIFSSFPFNLNSPSRTTDAISSSNISFQFEPVTPDLIKSKGQASNASNASINVTTVGRGVLSNEDTIKRSEANDLQQNEGQSELVLGQSELQESHKPDKEGKQDTDLNNTPQQKQRRRKHRPKVVIEGKPKRAPKPRSEKQPDQGETKIEKRKYVRRNKVGRPAATSIEEVNNTIYHEGKPPSSKETPAAKRKYVKGYKFSKSTEKPSEEGSSGTIDPTKISCPRKCWKSCRRSLNFEFEGQASDINSSHRPSTTLDLHADQTRSTAQSSELGQGMEATTQEKGVGTPYDIACSLNQERRNNFSQPEMEYPGRPSPDKIMVGSQNESSRGNCRMLFSDLANDKQASIPQMKPKSPSSFNCSCCACLLYGKGLKRQQACRTDEAQLYSINARGAYFNSMQAYQAIFPENEPGFYSSLGMYRPAIYKKKRTEIGQSSATSYTKPPTSKTNNVTSSQCNISGSPGNSSATTRANSRMQNSDFMPTLVKAESLRRSSNGGTRACDLASLHEIYNQSSTSKEATNCGFGEGYEDSNLPNTCMEAPVTNTRAAMKTKKQSKTSILVSSAASNMHTQQLFKTNARGPMPAIMPRGMSSSDELVEVLQHLGLSSESIQSQDQHRITYHAKFQGESALVLYQRDGSIVPFDSSFVRKRKLRPRVYVDEETDRVWKLLLQDINNKGIDGTDEDKAKWWEEERRVFSSRADSFIARMHLVQGDRRFSPWKGSVVDSVVGVFLTQNVSDHLSSSAFMSLAAQFPLKSKNSTQKHEERTGIIIEEPEVCATDPNVTIRWHEDQPNQPNHGQDSSINTDSSEGKAAVNNTDSNEGSTQCIKSAEHSVVLQSDSYREGLNLDPESTVNCFRDQRELDDLSSSPTSVVSSQNSAVVQTSEGTESINFPGFTSFTKLLQMAGTSVARGTRCNENLQGVNFPVFHKEIGIPEQSGSLAELGHPSLYTKMMTEFYSSCNYHQNELVREIVNDVEVNVEQHIQIKDRNCNESPTFSAAIMDSTEMASIVVDSSRSEQRAVESNLKNDTAHADSTIDTVYDRPSKANTGRPGKEKQNIDWDSLRLQAQANSKRERTENTMDSLDWEAVSCANVTEIAHTIRERGMNNKLAERIKGFLNRLVREHGSIDLEWLRDVPPDKAKEYLLSFRGLGLKSVECVRLLTLHHLAFPVDTNVGRIAVRLGWVPLRPLPESLQLHLLELYPIIESIQKYLWPRLCKLDQRTLYELHYQMITFGKVFCTKSKPNCNACPMRGECRHFASAFASARFALPAPEDKSIVRVKENIAANKNPGKNFTSLPLPLPPSNQQAVEHQKLINSAPIIEVPATPEPIVEVPATPEEEQIQAPEIDIEDAYFEDPSEIPLIELNLAEFTQNVKKYVENNMELHQVEMSKDLVALTSEAASIPVPKLKNVSRLRTEHHVYELPDSHPLLEGLDKREPDDPSPYLLAIWTPGETANSIQPPEKQCNFQESGKLCDNETCSACNSTRETHSQTVRGTILIPCRTAMRGSFPLNGTYFQVNEVFADHESSLNPINVPRNWLWNLPRRTVYFGTSIPTIFKGQTTECIQHCFWRGFVCVRGFDQKTRAPRPLMARLHFPASKLAKTKAIASACMMTTSQPALAWTLCAHTIRV